MPHAPVVPTAWSAVSGRVSEPPGASLPPPQPPHPRPRLPLGDEDRADRSPRMSGPSAGHESPRDPTTPTRDPGSGPALPGCPLRAWDDSSRLGPVSQSRVLPARSGSIRRASAQVGSGDRGVAWPGPATPLGVFLGAGPSPPSFLRPAWRPPPDLHAPPRPRTPHFHAEGARSRVPVAVPSAHSSPGR